MKKLLLLLTLLPSAAFGQCNGVFPANTICGTIPGGIPGAVSNSVLTGIPGGSNGQVQFNNAGAFGGLTSPGGTSTFLRADNTYAIPNVGFTSAALATLAGSQ
jgi:hypothetical protein